MQLPPFRLERYFAKYEFDVEYLLCSSDCESLSITDVLALEPGADAQFKQHWLGYTESQGSPSLRQEITALYDNIDVTQVLVHSGAEEAIFLFMQAVLEPSDHIVVHWPCYQSLFEVAKAIGCEITPWQGREAEGWMLDVDELAALIHPNTKAIILNTPHNPTGHLMSLDAYQRVHEIAAKRGILLFSDEVYRELEYDPNDRLPAGCDIGDHAVSLGVMSKTYGLAGLRIGWIATQNTDILARMASFKDYTTICNSAPSEFLAEVALRHRQAIAQRNLDIIARNLVLLDAFFDRHVDLFVWQRPAAGPIAFPKLFDGDVETFCDDLVRTAGVLLLPGTLFADAGNHFRIGYGRKNMPEALARLEAYVEHRLSSL